MPDYPLWLQRVPLILASLQDFPAPVVDRYTVERLFQVSRRQAIRIMHAFGGYQAGRTFLIPCADLVHRLEGLARDKPVSQVLGRKQRIWRTLAEHQRHVRAAAVPIPGVDRFPSLSLSGLPEGVLLERGRLEIRFARPEELLQKLYTLSQALATDYERYAREYDRTDV